MQKGSVYLGANDDLPISWDKERAECILTVHCSDALQGRSVDKGKAQKPLITHTKICPTKCDMLQRGLGPQLSFQLGPEDTPPPPYDSKKIFHKNMPLPYQPLWLIAVMSKDRTPVLKQQFLLCRRGWRSIRWYTQRKQLFQATPHSGNTGTTLQIKTQPTQSNIRSFRLDAKKPTCSLKNRE